MLSKDNQSRSWKKGGNTVLVLSKLSLFVSCILVNSAAPELSMQYNWGRATTFYILYHTSRQKLGHCYLKAINLNLGRRCGQTEIVCHWSLRMSLALAEQSIQLLTSYKQMKTLSLLTTRQPIQILKKVWPLFV